MTPTTSTDPFRPLQIDKLFRLERRNALEETATKAHLDRGRRRSAGGYARPLYHKPDFSFPPALPSQAAMAARGTIHLLPWRIPGMDPSRKPAYTNCRLSLSSSASA